MDPDGSIASTLVRYLIGSGSVGVHQSRKTDSGQLQDCHRAPFGSAARCLCTHTVHSSSDRDQLSGPLAFVARNPSGCLRVSFS
jgi:hypothetical protein